MKLSAILAPLFDAKADHELIRRQILAFEAEQSNALEERRRHDAERQARKREREKSRYVTLRHSDRSLASERTRVEDKTSNSEIEPQKEEKKETRERAFDAFWSVYPHKVGKADASKAFSRAMSRVDLETLMAGLHRYIGKTDDRPWCNPSTWLNQDRWTDEPAAPIARAGPPAPKRGLGDVFGQLGDFLDGQGHGSGDDKTPQGVVLRLPQRAAQ